MILPHGGVQCPCCQLCIWPANTPMDELQTCPLKGKHVVVHVQMTLDELRMMHGQAKSEEMQPVHEEVALGSKALAADELQEQKSDAEQTPAPGTWHHEGSGKEDPLPAAAEAAEAATAETTPPFNAPR